MRNGRSCSSRDGFVVLFPDSFGSRGVGSQCRDRNRKIHASRERVADANAARAWLQGQSYVRGDHISLLGWSNGGVAALWTVRPTTVPHARHRRFPLGGRVLSELPPLARNRLERPGPDPRSSSAAPTIGRRLDLSADGRRRPRPQRARADRRLSGRAPRIRPGQYAAPAAHRPRQYRSILPARPMAAPIPPLAATRSSGCRPGSRDSKTRRYTLHEMKRRADGDRRGANSRLTLTLSRLSTSNADGPSVHASSDDAN